MMTEMNPENTKNKWVGFFLEGKKKESEKET